MTLAAVTVSLVPSARTQAIIDGRVTVEGFRIAPRCASSVDDNSRQMLGCAFDVAEMSLGTYVAAAGKQGALVGLPIFPGRRFVHGGMLCGRDSGLESPAQLAGRRVVVPQYWLTSSIWHRGLLQHEWGVRPQDVEWLTTSPERGATTFPAGVKVTHVRGASIAELIATRQADAALVPRPDHPQYLHPQIRPLLADVREAERRSYARDGIFPIMHFIVARRELLQHEPALAPALENAFRAAAAEARADDASELWVDGLEANRKVLETFVAYCAEQGLLESAPRVEELFFGIR